jgi:hypothetical protein
LLIFFKHTKYRKKTDSIKTRTSAIKAPKIRANGIKLAIIVIKNSVEKLNFFLSIRSWIMNFLTKLNIGKINKNQNYIILIIILLSWSHQWLSIGSFINTSYYDFSLSSILAYRNQSLTICSINLFILIFNKKKNIGNSIYFYFFLIPIAYLLGLVNLFIDTPNEKNMEFFYHFTFILQMINTLVILNNFSKIDGVDEAILLKVNLLLIFIYIIIIYTTYDFSHSTIKYHINFLNLKISTNQNGVCRILSILSIFMTCFYFIKKRVAYLLSPFIINFLIINIESRQGVILIIIQLLIIIIFYCQKRELIGKMLQYFFLLIIIPLCLSFFFKNNLQKNRLFMFQGDLKNDSVLKDNKQIMFQGDLKNDSVLKDNKQIDITIIKVNVFTTGRLYKWDTALMHVINSKIKNILFGNGPEFDRKIEATRGGGDIANGILYTFLCGGLLGLFSFFILIKKFLKIILYAFYNKQKLNTDIYFCFSVCCIISLTLRSLVENGFLVYGVDFLLITSSIFYLIKKLKLI